MQTKFTLCTNLNFLRTTSGLYKTTSTLCKQHRLCANNVDFVQTTSTLVRTAPIGLRRYEKLSIHLRGKTASSHYWSRKTKTDGNSTQSQRGYVKEHIARSILKGNFSLLHAGNLRNNEVDYLYFKIDRIEHILSLSSQVIDIEFSVFPYVRDATEGTSSVWVGRGLQYKRSRILYAKGLKWNRGRPRYGIQNMH